MRQNRFDDVIETIVDLVVPEPQNPPSTRCKPRVAAAVMRDFCFRRMRCSIDFDSQARRMA